MTVEQSLIRVLTRRFGACRAGATAIEYALIASILAGFIILGMTTLGTNISTVFTDIGARLSSQFP